MGGFINVILSDALGLTYGKRLIFVVEKLGLKQIPVVLRAVYSTRKKCFANDDQRLDVWAAALADGLYRPNKACSYFLM
jgi:hypothetical protein